VFAIFAKLLNPNTVFELLHNTINVLILTDAGLWGILHAQRCQYTAQKYANIYWFGSQYCPHQSENIHPVAGGSLGQTS